MFFAKSCHHLLKTFWTGWRDRQHRDGTLILTSPGGQTHVSTPGSALLFPSLCQATGGMRAPEADLPPDYCAERTAMMPKLRRSRAKDREYRCVVLARDARRTQAPSYTGPAPPHTDRDDPPPF